MDTSDVASTEEFQVVLVSAGNKKISVIKVVRNATRSGLKEAHDLVEGAPSVIARELDSETAQRLAADLTNAGATAEVRPSEPAPPSETSPKHAWIDAWLQPNETVEATMRTSELLLKKDVVFTSSRILVADVRDDPSVETVPFESIASFKGTWDWLTKEVRLHIAGTRHEITLRFATREEHDRALAILNGHAV